MPQVKTQKDLINNYQNQADQIIKQMYQVLMRAQRKIDDSSYRKTLEKLQKETKQ